MFIGRDISSQKIMRQGGGRSWLSLRHPTSGRRLAPILYFFLLASISNRALLNQPSPCRSTVSGSATQGSDSHRHSESLRL